MSILPSPSANEVPLSQLAANRLVTNYPGLLHFLEKTQADKPYQQVVEFGHDADGLLCAPPKLGQHTDWIPGTPIQVGSLPHKVQLVGMDCTSLGKQSNDVDHAGELEFNRYAESLYVDLTSTKEEELELGFDDDYVNSSSIGKPYPSGAWTTLMIRNIPAMYTQEMLASEWPNDGTYDFLFIPTSSYCFLNFTSESATLHFIKEWQNRRLTYDDVANLNVNAWRQKPLHMRFSLDQGLENNLRRWRKKRTWRLAQRTRPLVFQNGVQVSIEEMMQISGLRLASGLGMGKKRLRVPTASHAPIMDVGEPVSWTL
jgi:hypothetical protein